MANVGSQDNLADVLEVVEIDSGDVTKMTAEELKLRIKEQIDASVDKFYRDHLPKNDNVSNEDPTKFNLSQFYSREPKQST